MRFCKDQNYWCVKVTAGSWGVFLSQVESLTACF